MIATANQRFKMAKATWRYDSLRQVVSEPVASTESKVLMIKAESGTAANPKDKNTSELENLDRPPAVHLYGGYIAPSPVEKSQMCDRGFRQLIPLKSTASDKFIHSKETFLNYLLLHIASRCKESHRC